MRSSVSNARSGTLLDYWRQAAGVGIAMLALTSLPTPAVARPDFANDSVGSLSLGMSAQRAASLGWIERGPSPCNSGWQSGRNGIFVGVWNDKVMMISTKSPRFRTRAGIRPGDSVKRLKATYSIQRTGTDLYTGNPVFRAQGTRLHFFVGKGKVVLIELANGFSPNGSEFEC